MTSTVSTDDDGRYGLIDLDSNLPDARISVGGPDLNKFSAVLESADPGLGSGLRRRFRRWIGAGLGPGRSSAAEGVVGQPDLRDAAPSADRRR